MHHLRCTHPSDIITEVLDAGLLLFGSPTLNNQMFPTVAMFLNYLKGLAPKNKAAAAFGSFGWSGQAVGLINQEIQAMKLKRGPRGLQSQIHPRPRRTNRRPGPGRKTGEGEFGRNRA